MSQKIDKKLQMRQKLLNSYSYKVSDTIATVMDKYYIDAIIGLVPGAGDVFSSVFMLPQLYLCIFKIRSLPLTLAVLLNILIDVAVGLIPFGVGNVCDFLYKAFLKNMKLINGYVDNDKKIVREVNGKAALSALLIVVMIGVITVLVYLLSLLVNWIWSLF